MYSFGNSISNIVANNNAKVYHGFSYNLLALVNSCRIYQANIKYGQNCIPRWACKENTLFSRFEYLPSKIIRYISDDEVRGNSESWVLFKSFYLAQYVPSSIESLSAKVFRLSPRYLRTQELWTSKPLEETAPTSKNSAMRLWIQSWRHPWAAVAIFNQKIYNP